MKDFYYILGTDVNCTAPEIKEAYRKLSKKFHPDLNFNDKYFEKHFREIKEAYDTLSNPAKRAEYDKKLSKFKSDPSYLHYAEELKRREEELRRREEKIRFRQAFPHYYNSRKFRGDDPRTRTRKVDIGFTLVLIIITLIFGNYVMNVVNDAKLKKVISVPILASALYTPPPVRHKKRHKIKPAPATDVQAVDAVNTAEIPSAEKSSVEPPAENTKPNAQNEAVSSENTEEKPVTVSYKKPDAEGGNYLYATSVISNVTGVTNMRRANKYSSPVISEIPTNSKVFVIQKGDVFYKVLCNNETGYVPKWSLEDK